MIKKDDPRLMILKKSFSMNKIVVLKTKAKDSCFTYLYTLKAYQQNHQTV